jgi:hypothetical protein
MKFLEYYRGPEKTKISKFKKDNYMFSDIHEDSKGNLIATCKLCGKRVDMAEHTNSCPELTKKD